MKQSRSKGFTLTEVVLAIGVVAVLIVVFMAMFIPARRTVQSALTIREADRIVHALTAELGELRNSERAAPNARKSSTTRYISAFDKAFYWMQFTSKPATTILVYNYRADLTKGAQTIGSVTYDYIVPLLCAAYIYFLMTTTLATGLNKIERRMRRSD